MTASNTPKTAKTDDARESAAAAVATSTSTAPPAPPTPRRTSDAPPEAERGAGPREWLGLFVLTLPTVLLALDATVLNLAVPDISADLGPSSTQLLWTVDIYGFMIAGFLVTMGTLGDRIGRRRLLLIGAGAFAVASVLAAFSTSAEMLIVTRALLGLAGATVAPSTMSLIRNMFLDERERTAWRPVPRARGKPLDLSPLRVLKRPDVLRRGRFPWTTRTRTSSWRRR